MRVVQNVLIVMAQIGLCKATKQRVTVPLVYGKRTYGGQGAEDGREDRVADYVGQGGGQLVSLLLPGLYVDDELHVHFFQKFIEDKAQVEQGVGPTKSRDGQQKADLEGEASFQRAH